MEELKPNSFKSKQESNEVQKKPLVSMPSKVKKKSGFEKFIGSFIAEDMANIGEYFLKDILVPSLKDLIYNGVTNVVNIALYGNTRSGSKTTLPASKYAYGSYFDRNRPSYQRPAQYDYSRNNVPNYDEVFVRNTFGPNGRTDRKIAEQEALNVIAHLRDDMKHYNAPVTLADFYDYNGITCPYTYRNYGWTNLDYADIFWDPREDGVGFKLPKPMQID